MAVNEKDLKRRQAAEKRAKTKAAEDKKQAAELRARAKERRLLAQGNPGQRANYIKEAEAMEKRAEKLSPTKVRPTTPRQTAIVADGSGRPEGRPVGSGVRNIGGNAPAKPVGSGVRSISGGPAQIKATQTMLKQAGLYDGKIDGIWGPRSQAAMQQWQQQNGLRATGQLDQATVQHVDSALGSAQAGVDSGGGLSAPEAGQVASNPITGDVEKRIREEFPQFAAWLDHPEIGPVLRQAAGEGWDINRLQGAVHGTNWWKETPATARTWGAQQFQDPATANQRWKTKATEIDRQAKNWGMVLDPLKLFYIANESIKWGWTDSQTNSAVVAELRAQGEKNNGFTGGAIADSIQSLRALSKDFLVPIADKDLQDWALRIADGTANAESYKAYLRGMAKERFSWLAPQIDAGMTPGGYFSSHRQTIAQTLELDANSVDLNDPKWRDIIDFVDDKGVRRSRTLGEAEDYARSRDEYKITDQANAKGYSIMRGLLGDLELV